MTKIAVAGATGIIGKVIVAEAEKAGHEVGEISRAKGVNLLTGDGLDAALAGVEAVIDASQVVNPVADDPITPIIDAAKVLTTAAEKQGVKRLVMLSINGVEKPQLQEFPFYKVRFEQEGIFADSSVESVVVRSVQWFEFALNPAGSEVTNAEIKAQNWAIQPAAMDSVATFLVEAAEGKHGSGHRHCCRC